MINKIIASFLGLSIGDALGVPVEFLSRQQLQTRGLVVDMESFGTHKQPAGTWSDDSSLTFCLAESLSKGYNLQNIANTFVEWYENAFWTAHNEVFDVGIATARAIEKIKSGTNPLLTGGTSEMDNGNGSLMRIFPLVFYLHKTSADDIKKRFECVAEISAITHAHIRSILACFIYCEYALLILDGFDKMEALTKMQKNVFDFYEQHLTNYQDEILKFHHVLDIPFSIYEKTPIYSLSEDQISGSGYVVSTLEASLWCFLTTQSYEEAVLKAVNLGQDTDTTACVTGGLAGLYYGSEAIPTKCQNILVKKDEIFDLCHRFYKSIS